MITNSDVVELLQYGERITLECKDSRNEISKSVWETYSAFANTCGGRAFQVLCKQKKLI